MTSTTYFGRPEPGGRRLGADFDLLAKWSRTFAARKPIHSYCLSQLSPSDRAILFAGPAQHFRLQELPDHTVRLETILDDGEVEVRHIDADVVSMMRSPNYSKSEARHYEMCCEIEDAQPDSDTVAEMEKCKALLQGADPEAAEKRARKAKQDVLLRAGSTVKKRWKAERMARLTSRTPSRSASTSEDDTETIKPISQAGTSPKVAATLSSMIVTKLTKSHPKASHKHPSPRDSIPDLCSETTAETSDWDTPNQLTDVSTPDPETAAVGDDINGGVTLLPFRLPRTVESDNECTVETPKLGSRLSQPNGQTTSRQLGVGLNQAVFSLAGGFSGLQVTSSAAIRINDPFQPLNNPFISFHAIPTVIPLPDATPRATSSPVNIPAGQASTPRTSTQPFSPQSKKTPKYPLAKEQIWNGFTCYDVPNPFSNDHLVPKYWTDKLGKERYVRHKLQDLKQEDARLQSDRVFGVVARNPIHIFVDLSNIIIGFYDSMKQSRGIPIHKRVMAPPFSFKNFDTILTRDRNVAKRVVAGSRPHTENKWLPAYMVQAEELGYEMNILTRVPKPSSPIRKQRKSKGTNRDRDSATSGTEVSGDDSMSKFTKHGEQGVDEVLHLKMLQSILDTKSPGTIVLATGDAAHAEYSDGFKKNIERALQSNWNIELYGWSRNISAAWREPAFAARWSHKFKIIELDPFCEELFDVTIESLDS